MFFQFLKNQIYKKAKFKIQDVDVITNINNISIPLMLIASKNDSLVDYHLSLDKAEVSSALSNKVH